MAAKLYYQEDCNLSVLEGQTIAIIGYGSQGHAHALNLKESGCNVIIGLYEGSKSWAKAEAQGFEVFTAAEAAKKADVIMILINDEKQAAMYKNDIEPNLEEGNMLMFAHGFAIHFGQIVPPANVDVTMIAPKAPGHTVRSEYQAGKGTPCLVAVEQDYTGKALEMCIRDRREEMELASERKRQSILRMELEWAKRGCRARTTKQKARLERLESLKNGSAPVTDDTITLDSVETRMGKKTMELHHVSKSYGEKVLVRDFSYTVLKNQKLGIIGPNGCGKSTLIKMMAGLVQPDSGTIEVGETVKIGYFAQEEQEMDDSQRVIDLSLIHIYSV